MINAVGLGWADDVINAVGLGWADNVILRLVWIIIVGIIVVGFRERSVDGSSGRRFVDGDPGCSCSAVDKLMLVDKI